MKKILTLSTLAMILTGCTNSGEVRSKPVNVENTTSENKESTVKEGSKSSSSESNTPTKVDTIDYSAAEEILKLYFGTKVVPDLFTFSDTFGEKLDKNATLSHKVSVAKLVDVYNALERGTVSKEDAIKKFANGAGNVVIVNSKFDLTKAKELVGSSINKVIYFTGDETLYAHSNGGVGGIGGLEAADKSQWKVEGDTIAVPTISQPGNTRGETVRLKVNNKSYSGGASKYKYYVDVEGKAATGSFTKVEEPKKEETTTTSKDTGKSSSNVDLSAYVGNYATKGGVNFYLAKDGGARIAGYEYKLKAHRDASGNIILTQDNGRTFVLENNKIIDNFKGTETIFYKE